MSYQKQKKRKIQSAIANTSNLSMEYDFACELHKIEKGFFYSEENNEGFSITSVVWTVAVNAETAWQRLI